MNLFSFILWHEKGLDSFGFNSEEEKGNKRRGRLTTLREKDSATLLERKEICCEEVKRGEIEL